MKRILTILFLAGFLPQLPAASLPSTQRTDGRAVMAAFAAANKVANAPATPQVASVGGGKQCTQCGKSQEHGKH